MIFLILNSVWIIHGSLCESKPSLCNECDDVIPIQPRQTVLTAAGSIGQASGDLLRHMGEGETDEKFQVGRHPLTVSMTLLAKQEGTQAHTFSELALKMSIQNYVITSDFIIRPSLYVDLK